MNATEYVEREKIENWLLTECASLDTDVDKECVVERLREDIPSADVRPVVLCRDCVKYKTKYCAIDIWHVDATIFKAKDTDFCSYGERNEGN